jgi:hypothetical protein
MKLRKIAAFGASVMTLIAITTSILPSANAQGWHRHWRHYRHHPVVIGPAGVGLGWHPGQGYTRESWGWYQNQPWGWRQSHPYEHRSGVNVWVHL